MNKIKDHFLNLTDIILILLTLSSFFLIFIGDIINLYISGSFVILLVIQFCVTDKNEKIDYFKKNIWDVLLIVALNLPMLRVLAIVRKLLLTFIFVKKINFELIKGFLKLNRRNVSINVAFLFIIILFFAGIEFHIEKTFNPAFSSFKDAIWWSIATVTTVGYGDISPITDLGKIIAVFLMIFGIMLYSLLTANLAAWLMCDAKKQDDIKIRVGLPQIPPRKKK